jgi:nitroreductase
MGELIERLRQLTLDTQQSVPFDGTFLQPKVLVDHPNPQMSVIDAILTRRTARVYADQPVPFELFERLIEAASHAPSACNEQRWKVIYLDDRAIIEELYARGSAAFLKNVRQAFLLLYNRRTDNLKYQDHFQSGASFITVFSLLAHAVGVGSCWVCHLPNRGELRRFFGVDAHYDPVALVSFGYYKSKVKARPRKRETTQLISRNRFHFPSLHFSDTKNIPMRRIGMAVYYAIPPILRRRLRRLSIPYEKKFYDEVAD